MSSKQHDFHPVLPNITDDSMKEVDADMEIIKRNNELKKYNIKSDEEKGKNTSGKNETEHFDEQPISMGKKIIIGILIVVIIVLLILLIYQIYKYYTIDEVPLLPNENTQERRVVPLDPTNKTDPSVPPNVSDNVDGKYKSVSTGDIPDHVRNLDNNVLSQYIKKGGNATKQSQNIDEKDSHKKQTTFK